MLRGEQCLEGLVHRLSSIEKDAQVSLRLCQCEQAQEDAKGLLWYLHRVRHPQFNAPPGYVSPAAAAKMYLGGRRPFQDSYEELQDKGIVVAGNPDTVIKKLTYLYERCNIGHMLMMNQAGYMSADQTRRSMELFAREVYPAIRGLGERPVAAPAELAAPLAAGA